ncbi:MAG TPA: hypothetical protein VMD31_14585, partial [Opitutaceae bacterium]|nr:hypothetical protein [Opitutaceae bacterium]
MPQPAEHAVAFQLLHREARHPARDRGVPEPGERTELVRANLAAAVGRGDGQPGAAVDWIRPLESQYLLQTRRRQSGDLTFSQLRRCQLDIETGHSTHDGFSD